MRLPKSPRKLKRYLLAWTLGPIALFTAMDSVSVYRATLQTTANAHDRLLNATAQQIGDLVRVERDVLSASVPLAMIEAIEGGGGSRMYYRVIGFNGDHVAGDASLPAPPASSPFNPDPTKRSYVARVDGHEVQVAALYQPVETSQGQGIVRILVAETMEARESSASELFRDMLARQLVLMILLAGIVWVVVQRALGPLATLRTELSQRAADAIDALTSTGPDEVQPVIDEMNLLLQRQRDMLREQQRLVADASHQLRTPMAVLKTQLQSAISGDAPAGTILNEMLRTVDRATHLINQLLNKARAQQGRDSTDWGALSLNDVAREAILEMSPLLAAKHIQCDLVETQPVRVRGSRWMTGELVRNLLANAIRHTPSRGSLGISLQNVDDGARMTVWDTGPGITEDVRTWLFKPFATGQEVAGSGLGLSICLDIAKAMNATLSLQNRLDDSGNAVGLDAIVVWSKAS